MLFNPHSSTPTQEVIFSGKKKVQIQPIKSQQHSIWKSVQS